MSPTMAGEIKYEPALSKQRQAWNRQKMGITFKCNFVYSKPWWRNNERGGDKVAYTGYYSGEDLAWMMDVSSKDDTVYALMFFIVGNRARELIKQCGSDTTKLKAAAIQAGVEGLELAFNNHDDPKSFTDTIIDIWDPDTKFSYGGPVTIAKDKGIVAQLGPLLTNPAEADNRIFFCGSDYSTVCPGYMDGAMSNGGYVAKIIDEVIHGTDNNNASPKRNEILKEESPQRALYDRYSKFLFEQTSHSRKKLTEEVTFETQTTAGMLRKIKIALENKETPHDPLDLNNLVTSKNAALNRFLSIHHLIHNKILEILKQQNKPSDHQAVFQFVQALRQQQSNPEVKKLSDEITEYFFKQT